MPENSLPAFQKPPRAFVQDYINRVLTPPHMPDTSTLRNLAAYDDGHYRATFALSYFTLADGRTEPTRSQWNTLKKRMKRHHHGVFILKETGLIDHAGERCGWVEFGFFAR